MSDTISLNTDKMEFEIVVNNENQAYIQIKEDNEVVCTLSLMCKECECCKNKRLVLELREMNICFNCANNAANILYYR